MKESRNMKRYEQNEEKGEEYTSGER